MQFNDQSTLPSQSMAGHQPEIYLPPTQAISNYSTRLMCAGIILLNFLGVHIGCVQTSFLKFYPEPLVNQGLPPPEEANGPFQSWNARQKYFLVGAVNETGLPNTGSPFTQADATDIAARLHRSRLSIVDPNHPILQGKRPREAQSFNPTKRVKFPAQRAGLSKTLKTTSIALPLVLHPDGTE
jgi:hypothetical protein